MTAEEEFEEVETDLRQMRWDIFVIRDEALALIPKLPAPDSERMWEATERMRLLCERLDATSSRLSRCETIDDGVATVRAGLAEVRASLTEIRRDFVAPILTRLREMGLLPPKDATGTTERVH